MDENSSNKFIISCVCCLGSDSYTRNIWSEYFWHGIPEIYGNMLEKCYGIKLELKSENVDARICEKCIKKLRSSLKFKQNILKTHKDIYEYFNEGPQDIDDDIDGVGSEYIDVEFDFESKPKTEAMQEDETMEQDDLDQYLDVESSEYDNFEKDLSLDDTTTEDVNNKEVTEEDVEYLEDDNSVAEYMAMVTKEEKKSKKAPPPLQQYGSFKKRHYLEDQLQACMAVIKQGRMSINQAATMFDVPRQTVQVRLKKELGDSYVEVVNKWRKHTVKMTKAHREKTERRARKNAKLQECIDSIKNGTMSIQTASEVYRIRQPTIKKYFQNEYGDRYKEVLLTLRRQYYKVKRENTEFRTKNRPPRSNQSTPDKPTIIKAVQAIRDKKMTLPEAANFFNIKKKLLDRLIFNEIDVENTHLQDLLRRPVTRRNYSQEVLNECLEQVRTGKMMQKMAAKVYQISEQTIYMKLREEFEARSKLFEAQGSPVLLTKPEQITPMEEIPPPAVEETEIETETKIPPEMIESIKLVIFHTNITPFKLDHGQYGCVSCDLTTDNFNDLRQHYTLNHSEDGSAPFIDQFFENNPHKDVIRLDTVNLACRICSEPLSRWSYLSKHFQTHNLDIYKRSWYSIIPYLIYNNYSSCAICSLKFQSILQLDQHMSRHYRNHNCDECDEGFLTQKWLDFHNHMKELKGESCECQLCDDMTVKVHDEVVRNEEYRSVRCHYCDDDFKDYYGRYLHMLEFHRDKLKLFTCNVCGKEFNWRPFYASHLKEHGKKDEEN